MTTKPKARYSEIELPETLVKEVGLIAGPRHHSLAFLARTALTIAARCVIDDQAKVLPPASSFKREEKMLPVRWAEAAEDSAETVELLKRAKTTRPAVVAEYFEAYKAAGGSLTRLSWPVWARLHEAAAAPEDDPRPVAA